MDLSTLLINPSVVLNVLQLVGEHSSTICNFLTNKSLLALKLRTKLKAEMVFCCPLKKRKRNGVLFGNGFLLICKQVYVALV